MIVLMIERLSIFHLEMRDIAKVCKCSEFATKNDFIHGLGLAHN